MSYPIYIFFGLAPSVIWLLFFLRKDSHPESNSTILKVFFWGMLAAIPTALIELGIAEELQKFNLPPAFARLIYIFVGIALVEEIFKYLVVNKKILRNPEFDEPIDIMLYMIISALGFAALENLLILFPLSHPFQFLETFAVSSFRFVGATFLHALSSGLLGYFLAISFFEPKNRTKLFFKGLLAATFLHGLYNLSIMEIGSGFKFAIPIVVLIGLVIVISLSFKKVERMKSICNLATQGNPKS